MYTLKSTTLKFLSAFALLSTSGFADYPEDMEAIKEAEYKQLDRLALQTGTDKSSAYHNYTKIYAEYFGPIKNKPIRFLEIGILGGSSVKLWENYFPQAELHFIDHSFNTIQYFSKRAEYHLIDQTDRVGLTAFAQAVGNFDVIIDDGGHTMDQQIISFETLFPSVKSGGLYIIEDLHTSYWHPWGGGGTREAPKSGPNTCVTFLQHLIDDLNYSGARIGIADHNKAPLDIRQTFNYYQEHITSMHFYDSLCIIQKR